MSTKIKVYPVKDASITNHTNSPHQVATNPSALMMTIGAWDEANYKGYSRFYAYQSRALIQFSDIKIPPGSVVVRAILKVMLVSPGKTMNNPHNQTYYKENPTPIIDVHRITKAWEEGKTPYENFPHWYYRNRNSYWDYTQNQAGYQYGGNYDPTPVASKRISYDTQEVDFDVTNVVRGWKDNSYENNGLLIKYNNDEVAQGAFHIFTKELTESGFGVGLPYIEVEFNEHPEPPRGLQPNNFGTISPRWGPVRLDWDFIDLENVEVDGEIDLVFMFDGSGSFVDDKPSFMVQLKLYLDRLEKNTRNYRFMLIDHRAPSLTKYAWFTDRASFERQVDNLKPSGGDYAPSHDVFMNMSVGARSLTFRPKAEVHLVFMTDEGLRNSTPANIKSVADWAISQRYTIWTIIHGCYLYGFREFSVPTGGQNIDLHIEWNKLLPTPKSSFAVGDIESGDYQSRAEVRLWKIEGNGNRTYMTTVHAGRLSHVDLDYASLGLVNKQVYEWDVTVYDSSGLSAVSDRAIFTYRDDDGSFNTEVDWGELPKPGDIVKRSDIYQFKEELMKLVPAFPGMRPSVVNRLFTGDIVPSREDAKILKESLKEMIKGTALKIEDIWTREFINDDLLDPDDIGYIRNIISIVKNQGPVINPQMTAKYVSTYLTAPHSITATGAGLYSGLIALQWAPSTMTKGGFLIKTKPSISRNLLFYRVHYNFRRSTKTRLANGQAVNNAELFHTFFQYTPQMFEDGGISHAGTAQEGEIFIVKDGTTTFDEIYVRAVDTEGHYSPPSYVKIEPAGQWQPTSIGNIHYYNVEYQVADIDATQPNTAGAWFAADAYVTGNSTQIMLRTNGSVWFRIYGVSQDGQRTDYTYTTKPVKILL